MKINKRFKIDQDPYNFIVVERIKTEKAKAKNKYREERKYYPTLLQACLHVLQRGIDIKSVDTVITSLNKSTHKIMDAIKELEKNN